MASLTNLKNEHNFRALGTEIYLKIIDRKLEDPGVLWDEIKDFYCRMEKIFSRFELESELSRLNDSLDSWIGASEDLSIVVQRSIQYHRQSKKIFDPRVISQLEKIGYDRSFEKIDGNINVPNGKTKNDYFSEKLEDDVRLEENKIRIRKRLDLSGIAKGYITDRVAELLLGKGYENFMIDSGGDMYLSGYNEKGKKWAIGIEGFPEKKGVIYTTGSGVATSGVTRRKWECMGKKFHHLIDPHKSEYFSFEIQSVTVVAGNTEEADVQAKVIFLLGKSKGMQYARNNRIAAYILDSRKNLIISPDGKKFLEKE